MGIFDKKKKKKSQPQSQPASCIIGTAPGQCTVNGGPSSGPGPGSGLGPSGLVLGGPEVRSAVTVSGGNSPTAGDGDSNFVTGYAQIYANNVKILTGLASKVTDYNTLNMRLTSIDNRVKEDGDLYKDMTNYNDLSRRYNNSIIEANTILQTQLDTAEENNLVNDRKSYYKNQNFSILGDWNTFANYAYILLGVIVTIYLLFFASLTWKTKLGGLALIVIMYFTMQYIVSFIILLAYQIYNILPTNVYTSL